MEQCYTPYEAFLTVNYEKHKLEFDTEKKLRI